MAAIENKFEQCKDQKTFEAKVEMENYFSKDFKKFPGAAIVAIFDLILIGIGWLIVAFLGIGIFGYYMYCYFAEDKINDFLLMEFVIGFICVFGIGWILKDLSKMNGKLFLGIDDENVVLINDWLCQNFLLMLALGALLIFNLIYGSLEFYKYPSGYFLLYRTITLPLVFKYKKQLVKESEEKNTVAGIVDIKIEK